MARPGGNPDIVEYGKDTRFGSERGCNAAIAGQKGNESQAAARSYYEIAKGEVSDETRLAHIRMLEDRALNGDIKALELLLKILKEYEDKISVEAGVVYEIVIDDGEEETTL